MKARDPHTDAMPSRETVAEAAAWIARLHGSRRSPEVEAAFREWLETNDGHARAFEGMTEIWETMPAMDNGAVPGETKWHAPSSARRWAMAAAFIGVCAIGSFAAYALLRDPSYATGVGEQRIVNLDDGTRVSLNSGTRIVIVFGDAERRIELEEGEAFFEVAQNARLPFVVMAAGNRVTAVGTSFAVRCESGRTAVTLVEGRVTVLPATASGKAPGAAAMRTLEPGQRWLLSSREGAERVDTPRIEAVTAWRRGEIIFDETLLSDAVAEINRYYKAPLVIDDAHVAQLPVSGIYRTGDSPGFARIVAQMYGLAVAEENGRIHLKAR